MYLYWPKDTERKKGLSKEESELLLLWFIPLPFLSSWTAKKTHWYWPDPLTACFYSSQPPTSALPAPVTSLLLHTVSCWSSPIQLHFLITSGKSDIFAVRGVPFPAAAPGLAVSRQESKPALLSPCTPAGHWAGQGRQAAWSPSPLWPCCVSWGSFPRSIPCFSPVWWTLLLLRVGCAFQTFLTTCAPSCLTSHLSSFKSPLNTQSFREAYKC